MTLSQANYKNLDYDGFKSDLTKSLLLDSEHTSTLTVQELIDLYNSTLVHLLDKHAPVKTKKVQQGKNSPWYSKQLQSQKRILRRKERPYRKTKLEVHREAYHQQSALFFKNLNRSRTQYCSKRVENCGSDQKKIFKVTNSLYGKKTLHILPKADSDEALANDFMKFFMNFYLGILLLKKGTKQQ